MSITQMAAVVMAVSSAIAWGASPVMQPSEVGELAAPSFSQDGGRYVGPTTVKLSAPEGAEIRYTLDGSTPTASSARYTSPITIDESSNLAAVSIRGEEVSPAEVAGYLIKTDEEPLLSFVVMSDIETTTSDDATKARWSSYFDTITSLQSPDLIISNGDQISDNNFNTGHDHEDVVNLLNHGLQSHDLDSEVLVTFGNHDDRLNVMTQHYPTEWFPHTGGGYFDKVVNGYHFLGLNTEAYSGAQRTWLQERLAAITAEPGGLNKPVFVVAHRPVPGTVNNGAQASNPTLSQDLAAYPQAVYISGHSHLNLNSEKSIHQKDFTALNDGSMSYAQIPRDSYQIYGDKLLDTFPLATQQGLFVEVYADRTEVDRIAYNGQAKRLYRNGEWEPFSDKLPADGAGTLAGPTWNIRLDGSTTEEIKANFAYTDAARTDSTPPVMGADPTIEATESKTVLRVPAATSDDMVYGYDVKVLEADTGLPGLPLRAGTVVSSDFFFSPRPSVLEIPLSVRLGIPLDSATAELTPGTDYVATVTAVDVWGARSEPKQLEFTTPGTRPTGLPVIDTTTQGNWIGTYGALGYAIPSDASSLPDGVTVTPASGTAAYAWEPTSTHAAALQVPPAGTSRRAATWFGTPAQVDVAIADGDAYTLRVYVNSYDTARQQTVALYSTDGTALTPVQAVADNKHGMWLSYQIDQSVQVRASATSGPNGVLGGIFFDAAEVDAPSAPNFTDPGPVTLDAVAGTALTREFTVTGNPTPTVTVLDDSKLPTGMTFTDGALSGTPTTAGTYTFILEAANGVDPDLTLTVTVNVTAAPVVDPPATGSLGSIFGS
ncbi:chitobiase/beta-hexosaminidase C-terminal domain-containing protein [Rhodococcus sp. OK302]|uniref:chitobiase/beta-hexosaminidase C-terminal domain-containing protein n=1 Tax=Rhodococcus sp. OK302 TaxID=1882769 RepID=UPI000B941D7C|nr:chitobiase/beta-hexosaminidase C-terminal domain-containing protein [Rhodococcus sp. OK302]OYD70346.1 calcineurin-like phosphoesterase family protein [Rhodococcus sp. OK302]